MKPDIRIRLCVIGFGNRTRKYLKYVESHPDEVELCAVVDTDPLRLAEAMSMYGMDHSRYFVSVDDFLASDVPADAVLVATSDKSHYSIALKVLEKGMHLLLEKPMARTSSQCIELVSKAEQTGVVAGLCYVMRYHPYYRRIKEIAASGELGRIVSISHREVVGIDRMTHTFVRGNWSREEESSPVFISKCCHDVDFLLWLTGGARNIGGADISAMSGTPAPEVPHAGGSTSGAASGVYGYEVLSSGSLSRYCPSSAPSEAAARCIDCPIERHCRYSAVDLYLRRREWIGNFPISGAADEEEVIARELRDGRYGRCVYHCDNDVMDYQEASFTLPDGVRIDMVLDGISDSDGRETHIRFEKGYLTAMNGRIIVHSDSPVPDSSAACGLPSKVQGSTVSGAPYFTEASLPGGSIDANLPLPCREEDYREVCSRPLHAGADIAIMEDFCHAIRTGSRMQCTLQDALPGSLAALAAEESRIKGGSGR